MCSLPSVPVLCEELADAAGAVGAGPVVGHERAARCTHRQKHKAAFETLDHIRLGLGLGKFDLTDEFTSQLAIFTD